MINGACKTQKKKNIANIKFMIIFILILKFILFIF